MCRTKVCPIMLVPMALLIAAILACGLETTIPSQEEQPTKQNKNGNTLTKTISSENGGVIEQSGLILDIAPNVLVQDSEITIQTVTASMSPFHQVVEERAVALGEAYEITMENPTFDGRLFLTLPYDPNLLPDYYDESRIVISYYNEEYKKLIALTSDVNMQTHTVSAYIDHLSWYSPIAWITGNKPPTVIDFYFSPSVYYVDCEALEQNSESWVSENTLSVNLHISDPNGLNDIKDSPMIKFDPDHYMRWVQDSDFMLMDQTTPGEYVFSFAPTLGSDWWANELYSEIYEKCGNLRTITANVHVRDSLGNVTEASASVKIVYQPVPEIVLLSPIKNERTSTTPLFEWDVRKTLYKENQSTTINLLKQYDQILLEVSQKTDFSKLIFSKSWLLTGGIDEIQRSYAIRLGMLDEGKRYYWRILLRHYSGSYISSEGLSFVTSDLCEPDYATSCVNVVVKTENSNTAGGTKVTLHKLIDPVNNLITNFTDDYGFVSYSVVPDVKYYFFVSSIGNHKAWNGAPCPFVLEENKTFDMEITLKEGTGTFNCDDLSGELPTSTYTATNTPYPSSTPSPTKTPTHIPTNTPKPDPNSYYPIPGCAASRLHVGDWVKLESGIDYVSLRSTPDANLGDNLIQRLTSNTRMEIIDGPECGKNLILWKIRTEDCLVGWILEADETEFWVKKTSNAATDKCDDQPQNTCTWTNEILGTWITPFTPGAGLQHLEFRKNGDLSGSIGYPPAPEFQSLWQGSFEGSYYCLDNGNIKIVSSVGEIIAKVDISKSQYFDAETLKLFILQDSMTNENGESEFLPSE
jgi:hypothetical protein